MFRLKDTFLITHLITVQSSLLFAVKFYFYVDVRIFLNFHAGNWNMFLKNMGFLLNFWSHNKFFFVALFYLLCGCKWAMAVAVRNGMLVYYTVLHVICWILYFFKRAKHVYNIVTGPHYVAYELSKWHPVITKKVHLQFCVKMSTLALNISRRC